MKTALLCLATVALCAQAPVRRAIAPAASNGWARVVVDDDGADGIWIGDAEGRSVPFLWETDAHWSSIPLGVAHPIWGKDAKRNPTGAFTLQPPSGFTRGDREQVKLDFDLQASATPWACRVEVARRGDGGAFVAVDDAPRFLYDLAPDRRATSITIPWDADDWRVTLVPVQGEAPKLISVAASAVTTPWMTPTRRGDMRLERLPGGIDETEWLASYSSKVLITGLEVNLAPPVAPVTALVQWDPWLPGVIAGNQPLPPVRGSEGTIWNLPALQTCQSRIQLGWEHIGACKIILPKGVQVLSVQALIRDAALFFPAEAGKAYFLHSGGLAKMAPGSLGELPASSRAFYAGAPLALGVAEADPQAEVAAPDPTAKLRRWLPWGAGLLVLLLGFWGFRLFKAPQD